LIAPFAFLGPEYDAKLREVYTSISPEDVYESRGYLEIIFSDAAADNAPLWNLVSRVADQDMLDSIAAEYAKGRVLLIATTNLDARRAVIWNIGEIAKSGHPKALELFHSILIASAAIPGAFPPVMFDVEVDGTPYQEMHVDGGAMAQTFVYPPSINVAQEAKKAGAQRERHLYIIRNGRLDPDWASVERHIFSIAGRAISSLTHTQGIGDLYRMYLQAERDGVDFNLAFIPSDFTLVHEEEFDTEYMRQLFDHAHNLSKAGYRWEKYPPDFRPTD
jgi:predicted acylesterase/phospholipase RssA